MVIWKNKENWDGHDCCLALNEEEVRSLVEVLDSVGELNGSNTEVCESLRGFLKALGKEK